jgi:hypothetical protein
MPPLERRERPLDRSGAPSGARLRATYPSVQRGGADGAAGRRLVRSRAASVARRVAAASDRSARAVSMGRIRKAWVFHPGRRMAQLPYAQPAGVSATVTLTSTRPGCRRASRPGSGWTASSPYQGDPLVPDPFDRLEHCAPGPSLWVTPRRGVASIDSSAAARAKPALSS